MCVRVRACCLLFLNARVMTAGIISKAVGPSGRNVDYLMKLHEWYTTNTCTVHAFTNAPTQTSKRCCANGIVDPHIEELVRLL